MNIVFALLITTSVGYMLFTNPGGVMDAFLCGGYNCLQFAVKLFLIYAVWLSVLKVLEKSSVDKVIAGWLEPISKRLFRGESEECYKYINLNLSANLLGMGGVATPMGIRATEKMTNLKNRVMLAVISSASIQIVPTTILSLRASFGASTDIVIPLTIVNIISTSVAILLAWVFQKDKKCT